MGGQTPGPFTTQEPIIMKLRLDVLAAAVCGAIGFAGTTTANAATACGDLKNLKLPETTITDRKSTRLNSSHT